MEKAMVNQVMDGCPHLWIQEALEKLVRLSPSTPWPCCSPLSNLERTSQPAYYHKNGPAAQTHASSCTSSRLSHCTGEPLGRS